MENILIELWRGNIQPAQMGGEGKDLQELSRLMAINAEKMEGMLNAEQRRRLEKYITCIHEYYDLYAEQVFCNGFRLGSKLFAQAWQETD